MRGLITAVALTAIQLYAPAVALAVASAATTQNDLYVHAIKLMEESHLIDTHVDLPQVLRGLSELFRFRSCVIRT
jgi:membrane dipeptidase